MDSGILSQLQALSYDDLLLLIRLLPNYSETLTLLLDVFQSEDEFIKFLDLFAGRTIKLPPRAKLFHNVNSINMWHYYKNHISNPHVLLETAHRFDVTTQRVQTILERINSL